jgi:mono/diheme cytochrome c family protein
MDATACLDASIRRTRRRRLRRAALALLLAGAALLPSHAQPDTQEPLPLRLSETGLYVTGSTTQVRPGVLPFAPRYALWSDGAAKQRWIALPPGAHIDASTPDAWQFPIGTRLWKEFSHAGRRVETRTIERLRDGSWRYATYLWNDAGTDALLAPARGAAAWPVAQAPGGRYAVPSRSDCAACHESTTTPVLGFSAVQVPLTELAAQRLVRNLTSALAQTPQIAARSATERAALGYLHANCGHCHNRSGAGVPLRLTLAQSAAQPEASRADTLASLLAVAGRFRTPAWPDAAHLIEPGNPALSTLALRMRSRDPRLQMPPLGTDIADDEGLRLVERWIRHDLSDQPRSPTP